MATNLKQHLVQLTLEAGNAVYILRRNVFDPSPRTYGAWVVDYMLNQVKSADLSKGWDFIRTMVAELTGGGWETHCDYEPGIAYGVSIQPNGKDDALVAEFAVAVMDADFNQTPNMQLGGGEKARGSMKALSESALAAFAAKHGVKYAPINPSEKAEAKVAQRAKAEAKAKPEPKAKAKPASKPASKPVTKLVTKPVKIVAEAPAAKAEAKPGKP